MRIFFSFLLAILFYSAMGKNLWMVANAPLTSLFEVLTLTDILILSFLMAATHTLISFVDWFLEKREEIAATAKK